MPNLIVIINVVVRLYIHTNTFTHIMNRINQHQVDKSDTFSGSARIICTLLDNTSTLTRQRTRPPLVPLRTVIYIKRVFMQTKHIQFDILHQHVIAVLRMYKTAH